MITVKNFSGGDITLVQFDRSYTIPEGLHKINLDTLESVSVVFDSSGGAPPPPPSGQWFTAYGDLVVWQDGWEFTEGQAPSWFFLEGFVLGILVFGTGYIFRILRGVAKQSPDI